ncbi:hypothetical protein FBU30_008159 [Linnemannia zychae]|nr:hypothetical protein FBU30_008159 [Linnemannia zychae]
MHYQKDSSVTRSVKFWFKEIEDKNGKTMFVEDASLAGFALGWLSYYSIVGLVEERLIVRKLSQAYLNKCIDLATRSKQDPS